MVEGEATAAMHLQQSAGGVDLEQLPSLTGLMQRLIPGQIEGSPEFSNAPYFFRRQALFPFVQGRGFIQAGLQLGGWKNLNGLVDDPPETTRQIFDPQAYFNHRAIARVALDHPPALEGQRGLQFLYENAMGELGYCALLGQLISGAEATHVGEASLTDRYLLYEQAGGW